ncbi:hypothetical protein EHS39_10535 [Ensifer sp. MPMI2T]|nr:hypothetical protein EHS39_10535 [Ensifer sp. MPMI2T]
MPEKLSGRGKAARAIARALASNLLHVFVLKSTLDLRTKTCSDSKCYSDLCASDQTRGAVEALR